MPKCLFSAYQVYNTELHAFMNIPIIHETCPLYICNLAEDKDTKELTQNKAVSGI